MIEFFKDVFKYHNHFNLLLADQLIENSGKISKRTIPLFSHMINAHQIWNSRLLKSKSFGVNDVRTLEENKVQDVSNYETTLQILTQFDLNQIISYRTTRGDEFSNSVQQMLFQVVNHHTHHRGQIISDLRQNGIPPIMTDYIFYKR